MRKRRKHIINAINKDVGQLAKIIGDKIIEDSSSIESKMSKVSNSLFIENEFKINCCNYLDFEDDLAIHYIMYLTDSILEAKIVNTNVGNSYVDFSSNTITIVSSFIKNSVDKDFYDIISYELGVLYQYGCCKTIRGEFCEKAKLIIDENHNKMRCDVAKCICYVFTNEQNNILHQFNEYLYSTEGNKDFNHLLNRFQPYMDIKNVCQLIKEKQTDDMVVSYIKEFLFNAKDFVNFIDYFENRLKRRLINVYKRYEINKRKFKCKLRK